MHRTLLYSFFRRTPYGIVSSFLMLCGGLLLFASLLRHGNAEATESAASPAMAVTVQTVRAAPITVWSRFSGTLSAVHSAEIRPEVSGRITEVRFHDGQQVKKGDVLYVIDPRPYEASLSQAKAALSSAKTNAMFSQKELKRAEQLVKTDAIAKRTLDERRTTHDVATASIQSAEAAVKQAELNVEHAYVKSPISGKVGRAEVTVGNTVQAGANAPVLTTVVASDVLYADFEVDEKTYVQLTRFQLNSASSQQTIPIEMTLRGDESQSYKGILHSFDNQISSSSGTIRARAKFANTDGRLITGMFASVSIGTPSEGAVMMIPERAVGTDQSKKFVYVVNPDNKATYREITLGATTQGKRIVTAGLAEGERVIIDGTQHVRPDMLVAPKEDVASQ
jgi:membrane fusion protein, multidrug efflux system